MENPLHLWLQQIQSEARKTRNWVYVVIAFVLDQLWELLKHRLYQTINNWLDEHSEKAMEFLKPVLEWFLHTPFILLILTICGILIHAYVKSRSKQIIADNPETKEQTVAAHPPVADPTIVKEDPRVVVEFLDERKDQLYKRTALRLTNSGGSEALDVKIETIPLRGQKISFPRTVGAMVAGKNERFDPKTEGKWGVVNTALFVTVLLNEWDTYRDVNVTALSFPLKITYLNFAKTATFETNCELVFYPYREIRNRRSPNPQPIIEFLNYDFRKQAI
jgi:hypothetical protein